MARPAGPRSSTWPEPTRGISTGCWRCDKRRHPARAASGGLTVSFGHGALPGDTSPCRRVSRRTTLAVVMASMVAAGAPMKRLVTVSSRHQARLVPAIIASATVCLAAAVAPGGAAVAGAVARTAPAASGAQDWPAYLNGPLHTSYARSQKSITPASARRPVRRPQRIEPRGAWKAVIGWPSATAGDYFDWSSRTVANGRI